MTEFVKQGGAKILVAHSDEGSRTMIKESLEVLDHNVVDVVSTGTEMIELRRVHNPELIISGVQFGDMPAVAALLACCDPEPLPSIAITTTSDRAKVEEVLQDHVMAYLIEPIDEADLRASIYLVRQRFAQFQQLRSENKTLQETLQQRRKIERAKGILMKKRGISEEEAYQLLQKLSNDQRTRMIVIAEAILVTEGLLQGS